MYDDGFMAYLNGQRIASANSRNPWCPGIHSRHRPNTTMPLRPAIRDLQRPRTRGSKLFRRGNEHPLHPGLQFHHRLQRPADRSDPQRQFHQRGRGDRPDRARTQIRARAKLGNEWSGLAEATFVYNSDLPLRITELMYHPARPRKMPGNTALTISNSSRSRTLAPIRPPSPESILTMESSLTSPPPPSRPSLPENTWCVVENLAAFSTDLRNRGTQHRRPVRRQPRQRRRENIPHRWQRRKNPRVPLRRRLVRRE